MSDNKVLSLTALASKRHDMKERGGINWLIDLFIKELPNYIKELQQAVNSGDGEAVYLAAHKFKGSASNLGAVGMVALCRQLEEIGHAGDIQEAKWIMENVVPKETKRLKEALEQEKLREK